ncbi:MAG: hypothetical protein WC450_05670 [Candidatus Omnitrophota bacterium]|jgi:hypothetical protein
MLFKKSKMSVPKKGLKVIQLFTFIEIPVSQMTEGILLWGESDWWPASGSLNFLKTTAGDVALGTRYDFKLNGFMAPAGVSEITQYEPRQIMERTFRRGFFAGYEVLQISERSNGTRIDYEMHYQVAGFVPYLLWNLLYKKKYVRAIELLLDALKQHVIKHYYKD